VRAVKAGPCISSGAYEAHEGARVKPVEIPREPRERGARVCEAGAEGCERCGIRTPSKRAERSGALRGEGGDPRHGADVELKASSDAPGSAACAEEHNGGTTFMLRA